MTLALSYISSGKMFSIAEQTVSIAAQTSETVYRLPLSVLPEGAILVCDASFAEGQDRAFYKEGILPLIPCAAPQITERAENSITLTSADYIHAVELEGEFVFEDNYFSLLPGESRTVHFRPAENAQSTELSVAGYTVKS